MSENVKHTPGPWIAELSDDASFVLGPGRKLVADVGPASYMDPDRSHANARLVAAAPDLLEACNEAHAWIMANDGSGENNEAIIGLLRAAIAQAKDGFHAPVSLCPDWFPTAEDRRQAELDEQEHTNAEARSETPDEVKP